MTAAPPIGFTEAEYLALEAVGDNKHELADGLVTAMAEATPVHNALGVRISAALLALSGARTASCSAATSESTCPRTACTPIRT